jgi:hypothetical protein
MFAITEDEAAAIRAVFQQDGELSAAIELRRLFPGITDNAQARQCARTIAAAAAAAAAAGEAAAEGPATPGALTPAAPRMVVASPSAGR